MHKAWARREVEGSEAWRRPSGGRHPDATSKLTARPPGSTREKDHIIGVNAFQVDEATTIDLLEVDNSRVRESQIARLETP